MHWQSMQLHVMYRRMTSPHSPAATRWDGRLWAVLIVLCGVLFLDGLDVSMVGVALPSIQADLGLTNSELQWIVSGYVLGYGGLLLLGGRVADLLGRKRTLIAALAVFTVASALGAVVDDGTVLVITRFIKGMAAAFTAPAGLSIITTTFAEGPARNKALTIYTATGASGFSLGLVLGGLLTEIGWRWTFLLPVPVALALLIVAPRVIRADRPQLGARRRFDIPGAVTVTAAMLLLVRTVVEAPAEGWSSLATILGFVLAAVLLATFVAIEHRTAQPLLRLSILKSRRLVRANLAGMALFGAYFGFQFVGTLYLQGMLGWSPVETALAFLPAGLLVAVGAMRMGPVIDRVGTEKVIATGLAASVVGYLLFLRMDADPSYAGDDPPHDPAARDRLRADLPGGQHPGHERDRRLRAGPRLRPRQHGVPGGRRARPGDHHRGRERAGRRRHRRGEPARRLPAGGRRLGGDRAARPSRDAAGGHPRAADPGGAGRGVISASAVDSPASRGTVRIRRPGWTASRGGRPARAAAASMSWTVIVRPQKRGAPPGASATSTISGPKRTKAIGAGSSGGPPRRRSSPPAATSAAAVRSRESVRTTT